MPVFSIVIPTYNSEKYIKSTIQSVLDQTFTDFELIIVDDGSKDDTRHIVNKYKEADSRITVITTPNSGGPATPTNIGINTAKGTYLAFLDHDDTWENNKLEILNDIFSKNKDIGFILSNVRIYDEKTKTYSLAKAPTKNNELSPAQLLAGNYFNTFSMMSVKRAIMERVGSVDTNLFVFSDYDLVARLVSFNIPHYFCDNPLVVYRVHQHNASSLLYSAERRILDLERILTKYSKTFDGNKKSMSAVYQAIARIYLNLGKRNEAIEYFKRSLKNDPTNIANYVRLVSSYFGEMPYRFSRKIKNEVLRKVR